MAYAEVIEQKESALVPTKRNHAQKAVGLNFMYVLLRDSQHKALCDPEES